MIVPGRSKKSTGNYVSNLIKKSRPTKLQYTQTGDFHGAAMVAVGK